MSAWLGKGVGHLPRPYFLLFTFYWARQVVVLPVVFGQGITHLPRPYGLFFYRRRDVVRWFRRRSRRRWPRSTCSV